MLLLKLIDAKNQESSLQNILTAHRILATTLESYKLQKQTWAAKYLKQNMTVCVCQ